MKKVFFVVLAGTLWSCSSKTIPQRASITCLDSATYVRTFHHIGGFLSSKRVAYDVYLGATPANLNVLNIMKDKQYYSCTLLGTGHLSYEVAYLSDSNFVQGDMLFYYSFVTDVRAIHPDMLYRMPKSVRDQYRIRLLEISFQ